MNTGITEPAATGVTVNAGELTTELALVTNAVAGIVAVIVSVRVIS
jgi:phosphotransferase system  glucose/maltose/N-acetylglucosamine-specific IIC component